MPRRSAYRLDVCDLTAAPSWRHRHLVDKVAENGDVALVCVSCKSVFPYAQITDVELAQLVLPEKPMVSDGKECECPTCGHVATYLPRDLRYRRN
jgi:hypothetical protein